MMHIFQRDCSHHLTKCVHFSFTAPGFTALIGGRPSVYVIATYVHT